MRAGNKMETYFYILHVCCTSDTLTQGDQAGQRKDRMKSMKEEMRRRKERRKHSRKK